MSIGGTAYTTFQQGSRGATDAFNRFVEGEDGHNSSTTRTQPDADKRDFWDSFAAAGAEHDRRKNEPERKDFWDDFSAIGDKKQEEEHKDFWDEFSNSAGTKTAGAGQQAAKAKSNIGTAAMSKRKPAEKKEDEGWGDW